jgi:hypothetical protein
MTLDDFRSSLLARVLAGLPADALVTASEDGSTFRRGALTVHVGPHAGEVLLSYVAQPTDLLGHSSFGVTLTLTPSGLDEAVRYVHSWLEDPFLHRHSD